MKRVLIIDDSVTVRLYHKKILSENGYICDEVENGMEALEKVSQNSYDIFLVDVNMPILDGYSFIQRFIENYGFTTPMIMISTESENSDKTMAYNSGANLYKIKPISVDDLISSVKLLTSSKS